MFKLSNGKNSKIAYYLRSLTFYLVPRTWLRFRLESLIGEIDKRPDAEEIYKRIDYYNALSIFCDLPESAPLLGNHRKKGNKSVYFFDSFEFTRYFNPKFRWNYVFGDNREIPKYPSIVKSRPIRPGNENAVLLNMDKVRHFVFLKDTIPFRGKKDKVIFRGEVDGKQNRIDFLQMFAGHPLFDVGDIGSRPDLPQAERLTLYDHLRYKFIMALEGNDVASNLKWVMSSNSIAVMPRPTYETWFMEGRLIPNVHYIEIKPDYSDLIERVSYYMEHPDEAEAIIEAAHHFVAQFQDEKREKLISLAVLQKYLTLTNR